MVNARVRPRALASPHLFLVVLATMLAPMSLFVAHPLVRDTLSEASPAATRAPNFAQIPLSFIPNVGQYDSAIRFQTNGLGGTVSFTPKELVLTVPVSDPASVTGQQRDASAAEARQATAIHMHFVGANANPTMTSGTQLPGVVNFMRGTDQAKWQRGVPTYDGIAYEQLYPGIDLRYEGAQGQLKSTYTVAPGVDPAVIRWRYAEAQSVRIDRATGNAQIGVPGTTTPIIEHAPVAWQDIGGERVQVDARYVIGANNSLGFALGSYNAAFPLIIDPTLEYSTYVGGAGIDQIYGIAVDGSGNAYIVGSTYSASFPAGFPAPGTYGNPGVTNRPDVLVAKLDLASNTISFVTVLGGVGTDEGRAIAVVGTSVYIAGYTNSADFYTLNPYLPYQGSYDAFAASLSTASGVPDYSTYIGGSLDDRAFGVAGLGNSIYVTGSTASSYGGGPLGGDDVFVTRVNKTVAGAGGLQSLNHFGGLLNDVGTSIAVNATGDAYITGSTLSNTGTPPGFPASPTPLQANNAGGRDAFVVKLTSSTGSGPAPTAYSSTVGGPGDENVFGGGIALDATTPDVVYLSGDTLSSTLAGKPVTPAGNNDAYVLKMNLAQPAATQVVYANTVGGTGVDYANSIVVDATGNAYIAGTTNSGTLAKNLPFPATTVNPGGGQDAFVARYDATGALSYSTLLGGTGSEFGTGIAKATIGGRTKVYVGGYTDSANFPVTANAAQTTQSASSDGFIARIDNAPPIIDLNGPGAGIDFSGTFTEGTVAAPSAPLAIGDPAALTVTDADNTTLQSVDVRFAATGTATAPTCPPDGTLESLGVTLSGGITGSYNNVTCRLTLTGPATVADFQNVLRTITYNNTSENPNTTPRIVVFEANDGIDSNSPFAVATINVVAVNDPPVLVAPATAGPVLEEGTLAVGGISVTDVDLGAGTIQVTLALPSTQAGILNVTASGAATVTGSGSSNVVVTGVIADVNATLATLSYTGGVDFNGTATLTVTANDQGNTPAPPQTATAPITITVTPVNDAPTVGSVPSFTVFESRPFTITVAQLNIDDTKDINPPAAPGASPFPPASSITVVTPPSQGNVVVDLANQRLIYTSNANPTALTDTFVINVCDSGTPLPAQCVNQTVNINITLVNDPPVAVADAYSTNEDVALTVVAPGVLANDDDPNVPKNLPLTAVLVTGPKNGALTLNPDGSFTYIPNSAFYGTDTFTYTARSTLQSPPTPFDKLDSNPVAVTITVVPQPDVPITAPDPYLTNEDVPLEIGAAQGLVVNDIDPDCLTPSQPRGAPNVAPYCAAITVKSFTQPLHGTVAVNTDGSFLYTPAPNYNGSDSFLYVATDGSIDTGPTVVTIIVQSVNDQPTVDAGLATVTVAEDSGAYSQPWGTNFSPGPADESAQTLTLTTTSTNAALFTQQPVVTLNGTTGTLTFTPAPNANGSATVTLTIKDNGGTANSGQDTLVFNFTIVVTPVNDPPTAVNDRLGVGFNSVTTLSVLQNDSIAPDADETLRIAAISTAPQHGTAVIASDGLSIIFTPTNGYKGPDTFVYQVCDNGLTNGVADPKCSTATVTLTIGVFNVYLPITVRRPQADLVGSFKLSPVPTRPGQNTRITVTVTNTGSLAASNFWVDFYIEPKNAPTGANTPWNENCKLNPCYGIAWFVSQTIQPGQSITLTSTSDSYARDNTIWRGIFIRGTKNLYLVVDSWNRSPGGNRGDPNGAIEEFNETNNVSSQQISLSTSSTDAVDEPTPADERSPETLAPRAIKPQ